MTVSLAAAAVALLLSLPLVLGGGWALVTEQTLGDPAPPWSDTTWVMLGVGFAPWVTAVELPFVLRAVGKDWGAAFLVTAATLLVLMLVDVAVALLTFGGI